MHQTRKMAFFGGMGFASADLLQVLLQAHLIICLSFLNVGRRGEGRFRRISSWVDGVDVSMSMSNEY